MSVRTSTGAHTNLWFVVVMHLDQICIFHGLFLKRIQTAIGRYQKIVQRARVEKRLRNADLFIKY